MTGRMILEEFRVDQLEGYRGRVGGGGVGGCVENPLARWRAEKLLKEKVPSGVKEKQAARDHVYACAPAFGVVWRSA
jgi:galactokinase